MFSPVGFRPAWVNTGKILSFMRVFRCIVRGRSILSALCIFHNYLLFWRCVTISSKELQINDEIRDKELRIIDTDGSQLGIMSASEALDKAAEKILTWLRFPLWRNRRSAKSWTTGNTALNRPSGKRKPERISILSILRKSGFPSISIPMILIPSWDTPSGL